MSLKRRWRGYEVVLVARQGPLCFWEALNHDIITPRAGGGFDIITREDNANGLTSYLSTGEIRPWIRAGSLRREYEDYPIIVEPGWEYLYGEDGEDDEIEWL